MIKSRLKKRKKNPSKPLFKKEVQELISWVNKLDEDLEHLKSEEGEIRQKMTENRKEKRDSIQRMSDLGFDYYGT